MSGEKEYQSELSSIENQIIKSYSKLNSAAGRALVPVIGMIGAGKSTLINYLLGCTIKKEFKYGELFAEVSGKMYVKIGHGAQAETLDPEAIEGKKNFTLCDFPGFKENRGELEKILTKAHSQLVLRMAESIKAVIVVIDYHSFFVTRGREFKSLSKLLGQMFNDYEQLNGSIIFAISKTNGATKEAALKRIQLFIESDEKSLKKLDEPFVKNKEDVRHAPVDKKLQEKMRKDNEYKIEIQHSLAMLKYLQNNENNVIVADVFDSGESCSNILTCIEKSKVIPLNRFSFNKNSEAQISYNDVIFFVANEAVKVIKNVLELPSEIANSKSDLELAKEEIQSNNDQIDILEAKSEDINEKRHNDDIENQKKQIDKNKKKLCDLQANLLKKIDKLSELEKKLTNIETDVPVVFWQKDINESRGLFDWWTRKKVKYNRISYVDVELSKSNGDFCEELRDEKKGVYQVTYVSDVFHRGKAAVKILVRTKDLPENKESIVRIKNESQKIIDKINEIENEMENLEDVNELLLSGIESSVVIIDKVKNRRQTIEEIKKANEKLEEKIQKLSIQINEAIRLLTESNEVLNKRHTAYHIFVQIASAFGLDSLLVNDFIDLYKKWLKYLENNGDNDLTPKHFICPISHQLMIDPVSHECGNSFDKVQIERYLVLNKDHACPMCRQQIVKLIPNIHLKEVIGEWKANNSQHKSPNIHSNQLPLQVSQSNPCDIKVQDDMLDGFSRLFDETTCISHHGNNPNSFFRSGNVISKEPIRENLFKLLENWQTLPFLNLKQDLLEKRKSSIELKSEAKLYGFDAHDVPGDGGCFFHAIVDQLKRLNKSYTSQEIREFVVDHIITHYDTYRYFIDGADNYIAKLGKSNGWADHPAIQATSQALRIHIVIINSDGSDPIVVKSNELSGDYVYLGYEVGLHYQSLHRNLNFTPEKQIDLLIVKSPSCGIHQSN